MTGHVIVHEEGSVKRYRIERFGGPVLHGDVEAQIREATADNLALHSGREHKPMPLWTMAEYCGHKSFEGWAEDVAIGETEDYVKTILPAPEYRLDIDYLRKVESASIVLTLARIIEDRYEETHEGGLCRAQYMGTVCRACTEGDEDSGHEPGDCQRQFYAREARDEFWWDYSTENRG